MSTSSAPLPKTSATKVCTAPLHSKAHYHCCHQSKPLDDFRLNCQFFQYEITDLPIYYSDQCIDCLFQDYIDSQKNKPVEVLIAGTVQRHNELQHDPLIQKQILEHNFQQFLKGSVASTFSRERQRWSFDELDVDDAIAKWYEQEGKCAICKLPMDWFARDKHFLKPKHQRLNQGIFPPRGGYLANVASIDRINSNQERLSYANNMQWVHSACNIDKLYSIDHYDKLYFLLQNLYNQNLHRQSQIIHPSTPTQIQQLITENKQLKAQIHQLNDRYETLKSKQQLPPSSSHKRSHKTKDNPPDLLSPSGKRIKYDTKAWYKLKYETARDKLALLLQSTSLLPTPLPPS